MAEGVSDLRGRGRPADGLAAGAGAVRVRAAAARERGGDDPAVRPVGVVEDEWPGHGLPLSVRSAARAVGAPPWHYAGTVVGVEFWTTPEAAAKALPAEVDADARSAGHGYALFIDWQFSGAHREHLDPVRSQYSEFLVLIDALWQGAPVAWCPFLYVDNDAALSRGWFQGLPQTRGGMHQKLGRVHQTRAFPVAGRAAPSVAAGGTFAAGASVAGRPLAEGTVTLERPIGTLPALERPVVNLGHFPGPLAGRRDDPAAGDPARSALDDLRVAECWSGRGGLTFLPVPGEELADLVVVRTGAGFRGSLSYTVPGAHGG